jgi:hypothetical protein
MIVAPNPHHLANPSSSPKSESGTLHNAAEVMRTGIALRPSLEERRVVDS